VVGVLRNIGYVLAAIFVLTVLCVGGAIISAIVFVGSVLLAGVAVIAFVAYCIKEYCENETSRPKPGDKRTESKESP
jgi:hypothetical protein